MDSVVGRSADHDISLLLDHGLRRPDTQMGLRLGVNVIPNVCDAPPGVITHLDLGLVRPHGLIRRATSGTTTPTRA